MEGQIIKMVNDQRSKRGLTPVRINHRLNEAARRHAADMVSKDYFSHTSIDGTKFATRVKHAGYACPAAENIAMGQLSEGEVMTGWMNSPGHRKNVLLRKAKEMGVARVENTWVQVFGYGC
jgi:uncharacterized protein YkwD